MDVVSLCALRVSSLPWQSGPGAHVLTVVCKATYELRAGESRLAAEQEYPNEDENHWNDDPGRSLHSPCDLIPFKPRADVLLVGHAFAPRREPVRSLVARLSTAGVDKSIQIHGDRTWGPDGSVVAGARFARMPLRYERAAGGPDTQNPVGMRLDGSGPIPNLQPVGSVLARRGDRIAPIGLGPIAARWPGRIAKLGPHAAAFQSGRWNERPLPDDLDASFFNAAPPDQQADRISPDAKIVLDSLSAQQAILITTLPGLRPRALVSRGGARLEEIPLTGDTLWIDTDRSVCTLVWRGQLALLRPREEGKVSVILEEPARPLAWGDVERRVAAGAPEVGASPPEPRRAREAPESDISTLRDEVDHTSPVDISGLSEALPFMSNTMTELPEGMDASPPWLTPQSSVFTAPPAAFTAPSAPTFNAPPIAASPPATVPPALGSAWTLGAPPAPTPQPTPLPPPPVISPPPMAPLPVAISAPVMLMAPPPEPPAAFVLASSNAAAAFAPRAAEPDPAAPDVEAARGALEIVELLWFDPAAPDPIRESPPWRAILDVLAPKPPAIRFDDEAPPPEDPQHVKDLRDVSNILTEAPPTVADGLDDVVARAVGPMGAFRPPLVLLAGELSFPFDEIETLKATVAAVAPLAAGDKKIKEIVDTVNELFKTPWLDGSTGVAEGLSARVREAFSHSARLLPAGYLDAHTERRLLEQRRYQRRTLLGRTWIRALLIQAGGAPIPVYLPDDLATRLPMFQRFKARIVAELHLAQDQYESHPHALRAVALARVAPGPKAKR